MKSTSNKNKIALKKYFIKASTPLTLQVEPDILNEENCAEFFENFHEKFDVINRDFANNANNIKKGKNKCVESKKKGKENESEKNKNMNIFRKKTPSSKGQSLKRNRTKSSRSITVKKLTRASSSIQNKSTVIKMVF